MRPGRFIVASLLAAQAATANPIVQIRTPITDLEMEVFEAEKPVTARNFLRLVEVGAYQGSFFHRLEPGFIVQGGGYRMSGGTIYSVGHFGPVSNEFAVGPWISNTYGTVAMAKNAGNPDSATSQFFINLANNATNLDYQSGGFTVVGRIIRDGGLLGFFNLCSYSNYIVDLAAVTTNAGLAVFSRLPVTFAGWRVPAVNEFFYTELTTMRVVVTNAPGGMSIAWNSATGLTNLVEYTDGFAPPVWFQLLATNGNGLRYTVTDSNAVPGRFYRIRIP